jgi:hypothetical protein
VAARQAISLSISFLLHGAIVALLLLRSPSPDTDSSGSAAGGSVEVVAVPEDLVLPPPPDDDAADDRVRQDDELRLDEFRANVAKIRARRHALFPFLTTDVLFLETMKKRMHAGRDRLMSPLGSPADRTRPPLAMTVESVQRVVDDAWSRRDRWTKFSEMAALIEAHDPDHGELPALLHTYLDQNLLQPYEQGNSPDSKFWVMMELVSDHVDFIDFIRSFARRHPSSRTTTELLFLLDELTQGSQDSLLMLLGTNPENDLVDTLAADRNSYALAAGIVADYRAWLIAYRIDSTPALLARYERLRLRILSTILESTPDGYRASDARFLIGEIYFNQNDVPAAMRAWRDITPSIDDSYLEAYSEILDVMAAPRGGSVAEIHRILGGERRRWLEFSRIRLRQFGYEFNTF